MKNNEGFRVFLDKVPTLRKPGDAILTILYLLSSIIICILFFYFFDSLAWYASLITQFIMSLIVSLICYLQSKRVNKYRQKYGELAYQYYFYHFMVPCLVTWYAIFFHPFFIGGTLLFPFWIALIIGLFFLLIMILASLHIERAGFGMITHGMNIYTIFPEESTIVRGEIYSYIRHPLYFSLTCGCIGLAFIANNLIAITAASLQLIPCIIAGKIEDRELIERSGEEHKNYLDNTSMLFPIKRFPMFLKLLIFFR